LRARRPARREALFSVETRDPTSTFTQPGPFFIAPYLPTGRGAETGLFVSLVFAPPPGRGDGKVGVFWE